MEEQHTTDVEQQTDPTNQIVDIEQIISQKEVSSRSMQTTPEKEKVFIDEELQTSPIKQETLTDIEVQTSPILIASDTIDIVKDVQTINEEVCNF